MAGTIKTNAVQLGDSATATQNFTLRTNVDGTATLARGNVGVTTQDILTVDANGKIVFSQGLGTTPATQSSVYATPTNGYGSTNTQVRRWTAATVQGTDITYADSVTLGGSFTINTSGVYAINYIDQFNAASSSQIGVNTTAISVGAGADTPATNSVSVANALNNASFTGYLAAGSVVRGIAPAPSGTATAFTSFSIVRVA